MWGVGLTVSILGILAALGENSNKQACVCLAFIVVGLVAMWAGQ